MFRNTWLEVDLDAIADNVKQIQALTKKKVIAVLKADAYGCGDSHVARAVLSSGAEMIAVSSLDEAYMLRNESYTGELLILGATAKEDIETLIHDEISVTAYSKQWVEDVIQENPKGLKVHLKIDSGMNRIGFKDIQSAKEAFDLLVEAGCQVEGIFTHYACADDPKNTMTIKQFENFKSITEQLNYPFQWIHANNSDAAVSFQEDFTNASRIGIALYGITSYDIPLHHPISFHTCVTMVKKVKANEKIGYGATYTTEKEEIIATLPVGYADGFVRENQGRKVYVDGQYCEVVGRVCMDQVMIRLEKEVPVGTDVEIFGSHIHLEDMAKELHTIPYEVLCLISGRVTRTYTWQGKQLEENARVIKSVAIDVEL